MRDCGKIKSRSDIGSVFKEVTIHPGDKTRKLLADKGRRWREA